jgi:nucleotide-binding universal stress UspA family protein
MTRVMIAVDGSDLDTPLAATAHRLFGADSDYWAVNVQGDVSGALAASTAFPAMYGGSMAGFGMAYPYMSPHPYEVRGATGDDVVDGVETAEERADATAEAAIGDAGISSAEPVAEVGDPPDAILRAAHEHRIDVIVVGDHDRGWWSRLFAPAVGGELIERAEVPILVVSSQAADRAPQE